MYTHTRVFSRLQGVLPTKLVLLLTQKENKIRSKSRQCTVQLYKKRKQAQDAADNDGGDDDDDDDIRQKGNALRFGEPPIEPIPYGTSRKLGLKRSVLHGLQRIPPFGRDTAGPTVPIDMMRIRSVLSLVPGRTCQEVVGTFRMSVHWLLGRMWHIAVRPVAGEGIESAHIVGGFATWFEERVARVEGGEVIHVAV